jgi:hypothetical protein
MGGTYIAEAHSFPQRSLEPGFEDGSPHHLGPRDESRPSPRAGSVRFGGAKGLRRQA